MMCSRQASSVGKRSKNSRTEKGTTVLSLGILRRAMDISYGPKSTSCAYVRQGDNLVVDFYFCERRSNPRCTNTLKGRIGFVSQNLMFACAGAPVWRPISPVSE